MGRTLGALPHQQISVFSRPQFEDLLREYREMLQQIAATITTPPYISCELSIFIYRFNIRRMSSVKWSMLYNDIIKK